MLPRRPRPCAHALTTAHSRVSPVLLLLAFPATTFAKDELDADIRATQAKAAAESIAAVHGGGMGGSGRDERTLSIGVAGSNPMHR